MLATANTFGSSLAAARFLSTQGGEGIAIYYVVFALVSIPAWAVYARLIDRGSRVVLLQRFMVAVIVATALLILASGFGGTAADYSLYTGISVLESAALQRLSSGADRLSDRARNDALFDAYLRRHVRGRHGGRQPGRLAGRFRIALLAALRHAADTVPLPHASDLALSPLETRRRKGSARRRPEYWKTFAASAASCEDFR